VSAPKTLAEIMQAAILAEEADAARLLSGGPARPKGPRVLTIERRAKRLRRIHAGLVDVQGLLDSALQMYLAIARSSRAE